MRSDMAIVLGVLVAVIICAAGIIGFMMYDNLQKQNEALENDIANLENELNNTKENISTQNTNKGSSSSVSSSPSSSSNPKVTYEEAGVNKATGYIKTCKYPGCGARYNSTLARCPKCGQKNIYV